MQLMRLQRRLLCLVFLLAACAGQQAVPTATRVPASSTAPSTATVAPTPSALLPTNTPLPSIDPERVFEPGHWHATVYHAGLGQVVLVNGGPETNRPSEDPLELWAWDGQAWRL